MNQDSGSPPATDLPVKRKRGRPRKDENLNQQENSLITMQPDTVSTNVAADDMMGQVVSGVVEGSFDAGYFLNVKVKDTDKELRGIVFIPDKVTPITAANDVAPHVKMFGREEIAFPSLDQQTRPQGQIDIQKRTECGGLTTDKNQSAFCMASVPNDRPTKDVGIGPELLSSNTATDMNWSGSDEMCLPSDMQQIKYIGGASSGEKIPLVQISDSAAENQALPLMPQAGHGDFSKQQDAFQAYETSAGSNKSNADTVAPKDSVTDTTRFVDFFPTPETTQQQAMGSGSNPDLVLFQDETKPSGTEQPKAPSYAEARGFNLMTENPDTPMENVPEELQLELGNKTTCRANPSHPGGGLGDNMGSNTPEANPEPTASKSGFLANLFEGEATAPEREAAASESGFLVAPQADNSTNKNVDCNMEEANPPVQP